MSIIRRYTIATGSIVPSSSSTSVVGSIKQLESNFNDYGKSCDHCDENRFLRCVNGQCDCQQHTYWNSSVCLPQLPVPCAQCQQNMNMCRTDLGLTCQLYNKCDYSNNTCNSSDIVTTETTTEPAYSISTYSIGTWIDVGNMSTGRSFHTSVLLSSQNDTVLLAGGSLSTVIDKFTLANRSFAACGNMLDARLQLTAAEIPSSGYVLFVGGESPIGLTNVSGTAELFDLNSGVVISMIPTIYRWTRHTMTFLQSLSKWLLVGGLYTYRVAEFFDPIALNFTLVNSTMEFNQSAFTATVLSLNGSPDDVVLIAGGSETIFGPFFACAELFNGSSNQFIMLPNNMTTTRTLHTATALPSTGKVLICGGLDDTSTPLASCELYDHGFGNFSLTRNSMSSQRFYHTATLLNNGKILVVGGTVDGNDAINSTDLYDPITDIFLPSAPLNIARFGHTATLLPQSGNLLVCGGEKESGIKVESCEFYYP